MPRPCTVCTHPDRGAIDADLMVVVPNRRIAAQRAVSEQAVRRHKKHLPFATRVSRQPAVAGGSGRRRKRNAGRVLPPHFGPGEAAREAGRKGGLARAAKLRLEAGIVDPYGGTILNAMDAAGLTGPTWDAWRSFLRAAYALPMDQTDLERLVRHTGRSKPPAAPVREAWLIVGRRGGKSRMAARRPLPGHSARLPADPRPRGHAVVPVIAADRLQARSTLSYLKGLLHLPAFAPYVGRVLRDHVELLTGAEIRVGTASYRTVRGYTLVAIVLEELAFWLSDETGANPDSEILAALRAVHGHR